MKDIEIRKINKNYTYRKSIILKETLSFPYVTGLNYFNNYYKNVIENQQHLDNQYYQEAIQVFKNDPIVSPPFEPYEVTITSTVTLNSNQYISLYFDTYEYLGGAHGITNRIGNTWNIEKQRQITLSELFQSGYRSTILTEIKKQAHMRQKLNQVSYFDDLDSNIEKYFDEKNFYIQNHNVVIFYPLYSIGPYYIGIQEFYIPIS